MAVADAQHKFITMNANGPSSKGMTKVRQEAIVALLKEEKPSLVFMQEFKWKNLHQRGWKTLEVPDYYQYLGHNEAGFTFDAREITLTRVDQKTTVIRIYEQMLKKAQFTEYAELSRMCICLVESKGVPCFKILCISWHGPYKIKVSNKKEVMRSFSEFIRLLQDEYKVPVVIGGDFNLKSELVHTCLHEDMRVISPSKISIDMILVEVEQDLIDILSLESRKWDSNEKMAFDHTPLKIEFVPSSPPPVEHILRRPSADILPHLLPTSTQRRTSI